MAVILVEMILKSFFSGEQHIVVLPGENVTDGCNYSFRIPKEELLTEYEDNRRYFRCESFYIPEEFSDLEKKNKLKMIVSNFIKDLPFTFSEMEITVKFAEKEKRRELPHLDDITSLLFGEKEWL
jgi:hypothetical protein